MQLKTRISLFIVLIIALHAVPVISYERAGGRPAGRSCRGPCTRNPFHQAPSRWPRDASLRLRQRKAGRGDPEASRDAHARVSKRICHAPLEGDSSPAYVLIQRLNQGRSDPVVRLRLEGRRLTLVDSGVVTDPSPSSPTRSTVRARGKEVSVKRLIALWNAYWFPTTSTLNLAATRIVAVAAEVFWLFPSLGRARFVCSRRTQNSSPSAAHQARRRRVSTPPGLQPGRLYGHLLGKHGRWAGSAGGVRLADVPLSADARHVVLRESLILLRRYPSS